MERLGRLFMLVALSLSSLRGNQDSKAWAPNAIRRTWGPLPSAAKTEAASGREKEGLASGLRV